MCRVYEKRKFFFARKNGFLDMAVSFWIWPYLLGCGRIFLDKAVSGFLYLCSNRGQIFGSVVSWIYGVIELFGSVVSWIYGVIELFGSVVSWIYGVTVSIEEESCARSRGRGSVLASGAALAELA